MKWTAALATIIVGAMSSAFAADNPGATKLRPARVNTLEPLPGDKAASETMNEPAPIVSSRDPQAPVRSKMPDISVPAFMTRSPAAQATNIAAKSEKVASTVTPPALPAEESEPTADAELPPILSSHDLPRPGATKPIVETTKPTPPTADVAKEAVAKNETKQETSSPLAPVVSAQEAKPPLMPLAKIAAPGLLSPKQTPAVESAEPIGMIQPPKSPAVEASRISVVPPQSVGKGVQSEVKLTNHNDYLEPIAIPSGKKSAAKLSAPLEFEPPTKAVAAAKEPTPLPVPTAPRVLGEPTPAEPTLAAPINMAARLKSPTELAKDADGWKSARAEATKPAETKPAETSLVSGPTLVDNDDSFKIRKIDVSETQSTESARALLKQRTEEFQKKLAERMAKQVEADQAEGGRKPVASQVIEAPPPKALQPSKIEAPRIEAPRVVAQKELKPTLAKQPEPTPSPAFVAALQTQQEEAVQPLPPRVQNRTNIRETPVEALPDGSPFEVIEEKGRMTVMVRRSTLLRTKVDIYRTAVVDDAICEVIQFTPREVSIIGKSTGATHVTFWFEDPNMKPLTYLVKVEPDTEEVRKVEQQYLMLEQLINEMFPDSKVRLTVAANKLIVKGQAKDSEEAAQIITILRSQQGIMGRAMSGNGSLNEGIASQVLTDSANGSQMRMNLQIINMLRVPGVQQVALRVKIAELNRTAARNFGVDVAGSINVTDNVEGSRIFLNSLLNSTGGQSVPILTQFDGDDIRIGLNYLQQQGVIRLLAEPTLVTMSGRPATFVAGGEFAVPTAVGVSGLNAVTTDFRAFGAIISFLPTVVDKDRVRLQVSPEFSQINTALAVNNVPGLRTRSATTTVEMREGQTLAIAGLLEDNTTSNIAGNIPFVWRVFGRKTASRSETELIILVTPELVHPMEPEEVPPLPGFDVTEPTNAQFYLHGAIEGNPTREYRSTVWPRLHKRYGAGGPAMTSGPFGHGQ